MSSSTHSLLAATALTVAALALPQASLAQSSSDGVHVDHSSPAGTQYDIPIARARREAQSSQDSKSNGGTSLFGAGVKKDVKSTGAKPTGKSTGKGEKPSHRKAGAAAATGSSDPPKGGQQIAFRQSDAQGGGSGALIAVGGIALALVAVATLGGWTVRRRSA